MKNWIKIALVVSTASAGWAAIEASAQVSGDSVRSRGVLILKPSETPTPVPSPTASPTPAPAPTPVVVKPVVPLPVIKDCPRPVARPDLTLTDGTGFDRRLKSRLTAQRGAVVVDLASPYTLGGTTPPALSPWLGEVKASGGAIRVVTYCQESRGMFGNFLKKLFGSSDAKPYKAADSYDVVLHVNGLDQRVTQVEFTPRVPK